VVGQTDIGTQFYALSRLCKRATLDIISVDRVSAADVISPLSAKTAAALGSALRAVGPRLGGALRTGFGGVAWAEGGVPEELLGLKVVNVQRYTLPALIRWGGLGGWVGGGVGWGLGVCCRAGVESVYLISRGTEQNSTARHTRQSNRLALRLELTSQRHHAPQCCTPPRNVFTAALLPESIDVWVTTWLLVAADGEAAGTILEHRWGARGAGARRFVRLGVGGV